MIVRTLVVLIGVLLCESYKTFLKEIDSGKPISTTEQYNSEHDQQERLDKLVQNENYKFCPKGLVSLKVKDLYWYH